MKPRAKNVDFMSIPGYKALSANEQRVFRRLYHLSSVPYTMEHFRNRRGYAGRGVDVNGIPTTVDSTLRRHYRDYRSHGGTRTWEAWIRRRELASLSPAERAAAILAGKGLAKINTKALARDDAGE